MHTTLTRDAGWSLGLRREPEAPPPILGIAGLRYLAEDLPGVLPPVAGLRATAQGIVGAKPGFDAFTGQVTFQDLPPGPRRILITDPEARFLPAAIEVDIPPRLPARPTAAAQTPSAEPPRRTVLLRPHPGRAVPDGVTAVIGTVRDAAGRAVPLARLAAATRIEGRPAQVVTFAAADGAFVLLLPGAPRGAGAVEMRGLVVSRPVERLAAALAADVLSGLPAGPQGTPPPALFAPASFVLHGADGMAAEAPAGQVPLRPGRTTRWDIRLTG
jgi:hypothetical protein